MTWVVVPAAGRGARFGGEIPKQYLDLLGRPLIEHTLRALLAHPSISGAMVALSANDPHWRGWRELEGKPVLTCLGGGERADSVLAGLRALPASVPADDWVLVHDAARPCVKALDLSRLFAALKTDPVGALLAAPVRDTLKRAGDDGRVESTVPRGSMWRALTPQAFRRDSLVRALESAERAGVVATDEAMAIERLGLKPLLVEGSEDNLKVTTPADLAVAESILRRMGDGRA
jgi:2-C-methyl-D-erythritol 4-phosphate cytidylyltransferase